MAYYRLTNILRLSKMNLRNFWAAMKVNYLLILKKIKVEDYSRPPKINMKKM